MSVDHKLESLEGRKRDLERELASLAETKSSSGNTALGELEMALMGELDQIEARIELLHAYISACEPVVRG